MSAPSGSRAIGAAAAVAVLLLLLLVGLLPSGGPVEPKSVFEASDEGRLAVWYLLEQLGYDPVAWRDAPGRLPRGEQILWLAVAPDDPPGYLKRVWDEEDAEPSDGPTISRRLRDPQHYRRFVEEGGTLVVGLDDERREFLVETLGFHEIAELESRTTEWREPQEVRLRTGEVLEVDWGGRHWLGPLDSDHERLMVDHTDRPLAVRVPLGRGALAILPTDEFLANGAIGADENALFLVRFLEELGPRGTVLFDEYALGGWVPETPFELAFAPSVFAFTVHLLALCLLILWGVAWTRQFARDPEPLGQLSPLSRATGHANMLVSAGRWDMLGRMLRRGVLRRLSTRWRVREPEGGDDEEIKRTLAPLARLATRSQEVEAWRRSLRPGSVAGADALEGLGRRLAHIERLARAGRNGHNARGGPSA